MRKTRELDVVYGRVKDHDGSQAGAEERSLLEEDPVLILIEFGKMMGFRLIDLFASKAVQCLTYIRRLTCPILIIWMSPHSFLAVSCVLFFIFISFFDL